jgi:hypothetical protein
VVVSRQPDTDAMAFPVEAVDGMDYEDIGGALDECGFVVQAGVGINPFD